MHETTPRYTKDIGVLKVHKDRVLMFFVPHLVIDASRSEVSTSIQASSASAWAPYPIPGCRTCTVESELGQENVSPATHIIYNIHTYIHIIHPSIHASISYTYTSRGLQARAKTKKRDLALYSSSIFLGLNMAKSSLATKLSLSISKVLTPQGFKVHTFWLSLRVSRLLKCEGGRAVGTKQGTHTHSASARKGTRKCRQLL